MCYHHTHFLLVFKAHRKHAKRALGKTLCTCNYDYNPPWYMYLCSSMLKYKYWILIWLCLQYVLIKLFDNKQCFSNTFKYLNTFTPYITILLWSVINVKCVKYYVCTRFSEMMFITCRCNSCTVTMCKYMYNYITDEKLVNKL